MRGNMLTQLHIKNFALISNLTLDFESGLIVLTGETGAGKSILIDAIRFVLGERLDQIRGLDKDCASWVEAVFDLRESTLAKHPSLQSYLSEEEDLLILTREAVQGKSKAFVNQRLVNAGTLKEIGDLLIDIHGQFDHQLLFEPHSQLELLDRLAQNYRLKERYQKKYEQYRELVRKKDEVDSLKEGRERELDLLKYQIEEIKRAAIESEDEASLQTEKIRLANAEKLSELSAKILSNLDHEEAGASVLFQQSARELSLLCRLDPSLEKLKTGFEDLQLQLEEKIRELRDYQENLSYDPERLEELDKHLDLFELLKKKYGRSLEAVKVFFKEAKSKYEKLVNLEHHETGLGEELSKIAPELKEIAFELSQNRKKSAAILKSEIEKELKDLELKNAAFEVQIDEADFGPSGRDKLEFLPTSKINPHSDTKDATFF